MAQRTVVVALLIAALVVCATSLALCESTESNSNDSPSTRPLTGEERRPVRAREHIVVTEATPTAVDPVDDAAQRERAELMAREFRRPCAVMVRNPDGSVASGAHVAVWKMVSKRRRGDPQQLVTNAEGWARCELVDTYHISVEASFGELQTPPTRAGVELEGETIVEIELERIVRPRGHVRMTTGEAAGGARVYVSYRNELERIERALSVLTNADGSFEAPAVPMSHARVVDLHVDTGSHPRLFQQHVDPGPGDLDVEFVVVPGARILAHCIDRNGNPAEGVSVSARRDSRVVSLGVTDADGRIDTSRVPADLFDIAFQHRGHGLVVVSRNREGSTTDLGNIALPPPRGIPGRLDPVPPTDGTTVSVHAWEVDTGVWVTSTTTRPNGQFWISGLRDGVQYRLRAYAHLSSNDPWTAQPYDGPKATTGTKQTTFALPALCQRLFSFVDTGSGAPIPLRQYRLSVVRADDTTALTTSVRPTPSSSRLRVALRESGSFTVVVDARDYDPVRVEDVAFAAGDEGEPVIVRLTRSAD